MQGELTYLITNKERELSAAAYLEQARIDNKRRVPCPHCAVPFLPENLERHLSYHED